MNENEINDKREKKDLRVITFSKYKKTDVKKKLIDELFKENLEQSIYWSIELICSGLFMDLWEIILQFISKYIHLGNPKIPIYIELRFNNFKDIIVNGYIGNELALRNNDKIRKLFGEIICVLCISPKRHGFNVIKINKNTDFNLTQLNNRLKAPSTRYADDIFRKEDPKELFISINEFAYHLSEESRNLVDACFWIEWIIEFEVDCKSIKKKLECERRENMPVDSKYQKDIIWIVWDIILTRANNITSKNREITKKIINSLLSLFCLHYGPGCKKKRRYILYFAISIIIDNCNYNIQIFKNKELIENIVGQVNKIYKQVKKSEVSPDTDYLFDNGIVGKSNLEKTVEKLDKMKEIMNVEI